MIKVVVNTEFDEHVTFSAMLSSSCTPNDKIDNLIVELELAVQETPPGHAFFDRLRNGEIIRLSIGGSDFKEWKYAYLNSNGFIFRQIFETPL